MTKLLDTYNYLHLHDTMQYTFRKRMVDEFNKFSGHYVEVNGRVLTEDIVKAVPWAGHAVWRVSADSVTLAKNPGLSVLSDLLRREVALGNVVRQVIRFIGCCRRVSGLERGMMLTTMTHTLIYIIPYRSWRV